MTLFTNPQTTLQLRSFGIIAHVDAGKTTLTERILYLTGRNHRQGEVHHGNTTTDVLPEERKRGITITAAAVHCDHRGHRLQLIDTPGHVDFDLEVERSLRVLDGAVVVIDAVAGVQPQTESVWRKADKHGVPRLVFVNKMDRPGASFVRACSTVEARLGVSLLPIVLPLGEAESFEGVLDVIRERALLWPAGDDGTGVFEVPLTDAQRVEVRRARAHVVDVLSRHDEAVVLAFVERGEVSASLLMASLRRAVHARLVVPALAGSAFAKRGVQPLLDAIVDYLPSPAEARPAVDQDGVVHAPDAHAPLVALVFKTAHDEHGSRAFVRVYTGTLRRGETILVSPSAKRERVGRLLRVHANDVEDITSAGPGEVVAIVSDELATGSTLSSLTHRVSLEPVMIPAPVFFVALEPLTREDRERMPVSLQRLTRDDPSLVVRVDRETGETTLGGRGELHLEVAVDRLASAHRTHLRSSAPRVALRETVRHSATIDHQHVKQSGGPGQYAHVVLSVTPIAAEGDAFVGDEAFAFVDETVGGLFSEGFVRAIREGASRALSCGPLTASKVVGVRVALQGGSTHSHDSSEMAFTLCAEKAVREALRKAEPVLLEPLVTLTVEAPTEVLGDVLGDLGARRARVEMSEAGERGATVCARVPLVELFGYTAQLRSRTRGAGTSSQVPRGFAVAPESVAQRLQRIG